MGRVGGPVADLSDQQFLAALEEQNGSRKALARALGVTDKAIRKRLAKIEAEGTRYRRTLAPQTSAPAVVTGEVVEPTRRLSDMERIDVFLARLDRSLAMVDTHLAEIEQKKRIQPWVIELLLKVVREGRGLVDARQKIRKDFYDEMGTRAFMDAILKVMVRKDETLAREFFVELAQLGFGGAAYELSAVHLPRPE